MRATILPAELPQALDGRSGLKVLSLDCFDTLLWRDVHAPADIFSLLPEITVLQRVVAEGQARKAALIARSCNEVRISDIYEHVLPNAADGERAEAIAAELAAEARHCFAYRPTVELMRAAKAQGLQVVIVSDTYLDETQLRGLIAASAGEDIAALIDRIFCSSTIGKSKAEGMFAGVLGKLKVRPEQILHIGDNKVADFDGARAFRIPALHLEQFSEQADQRLRLESSIASMIGQAQGRVSGAQPHRAVMASAEPANDDATANLGLTTLGPIFHGFEQWLAAEAAELSARHGGTVHWLFLMRDGHLPREVHQLVAGQSQTSHAVEISRFTATAASLTDNAAIDRHIEAELGQNPSTLARQMLLGEADIARLVDEDDPVSSSHALLREVRTGKRKQMISRAARAFGERLIAHVKKVVDPRPGDTLMLVDLGYNGSVQNRIHRLLAETLEVQVAGRYLLLREQDRSGFDKRGMIDTTTHDLHLLEAMCANVAVLEQLCTAEMGSVVDYEQDGSPIRRKNDIKQRQSVVRQRVQQGCLDFVRTEAAGVALRAQPTDLLPLWRDCATAALARLMYLPLPKELAVIESFEHDVNMGSEKTVGLFDPEVAAEGLRRRGMFYMKGSQRMYLPAELTGQGLATRLSLFAQKRFGLEFTYRDFSEAELTIPALFIDGEQISQSTIRAQPTHEGYYIAAIPIGENRLSVAVQFGAGFEWLQIDSVTALPVKDFLAGERADLDREEALSPTLDGMTQVAPHLFECREESGFMMIHPPRSDPGQPMIAAIVFRPLATRTAQAAGRSPLAAEGHLHRLAAGLA